MTAMEWKQKQPLQISSLVVLGLTALLALAAITIVFGSSWGYYRSTEESMNNSDVLTSFDLETIDGGRFTAAELKNTKLTAVNIWGTDCPPCIGELPDLQKLNDNYDDAVFRVIGIPYDVNPSNEKTYKKLLAEAQRICETANVLFPNMIPDEEMLTYINSFLAGTPTTLLLDQNGTVVGSIVGSRSYADWETIIAEKLEDMNHE